MARIPEETIRKVLEATDIVALIGSYIPLKKAGTLYKGCCPFHNEKTPSFTVSPTRQSFKCFGCGEGGSAVGFVMKFENMSFGDSLRKIADKAGLHVEEEAYDPQADRQRRQRIRLVELHKAAAEWFHKQLKTNAEAQKARDYLNNRGFNSQMAANWQIGWTPEDSGPFLEWAKAAGFTGKELVDSGLCFLKRENNPRSGLMCRFRDRLMFPIANDYGEIIAFSGRILEAKDNTGKYINSPETSIFRKGNVIFALNRARRAINQKNTALLCEGQIDVIACHEAGIENAIAPLGTAFTTQHARLLRRYTTKVTLCFDGDSAGMKAADRAFRELAPEGLYVNLLTLPKGDDPDSFLKREGADGFHHFIASSKPFFEARLSRARQEGVLDDPASRTEFIASFSTMIALLPDKVYQDGIITDMATMLRMGIPELRVEVQNAAHELARQKKLEAGRVRPEEDHSDTASQAQSNKNGGQNNDYSEDRFFQTETPEIPRQIPMDRPVQQLCELALQFRSIFDLLLNQIEDLVSPLSRLRGGHLLKLILASELDPSSPVSLQCFLESLGTSESFTLRKLDLNAPEPENAEAIVLSLIAEVSRMALTKEKEVILSALRKQDILPEEQMRAFARLHELSILLCPPSPGV